MSDTSILSWRQIARSRTSGVARIVVVVLSERELGLDLDQLQREHHEFAESRDKHCEEANGDRSEAMNRHHANAASLVRR
jgi:hypothetical protein